MAGTLEKSFLAVALFGSVLPHAGWAHGPSRQKITETIQIDAPPANVRATIANFHDMSWLPGVAKTTGEGGNELDPALMLNPLRGRALRNPDHSAPVLGSRFGPSIVRQISTSTDLPHRIDELRAFVDAFAHRYNHYRPHAALGGRTPADYLQALSHVDPPPSHIYWARTIP